jgi:alpha-mannosidase
VDGCERHTTCDAASERGAAQRHVIGRFPTATEASLLQVVSDHVAVDTIKRAEDTDDWIIRCYEFAGKREKTAFQSAFQLEAVEEVNLLERDGMALPHTSRQFSCEFTPHVIKTFRVRLMS